VTEVFMSPVKGGDMLGVIGAGYPVYKYWKAEFSKTMTSEQAEKAAMKRAESFIIDTQQSALPEHANQIMQSHPGVRIFGAYQQAPSMYRAKGYEAIRAWQTSKKTKADTKKMVQEVLTYHVVLPVLFDISMGKLNPYTIVTNSLLSPVTGLMGYGKVVQYGVLSAIVIPLMKAFGADDEDIEAVKPFPLEPLTKDAVEAFDHTINAIGELIKEPTKEAAIELLEGVGFITKIPVGNLIEEKEKVEDVIEGDAGLRRLLETRWQYEQRTESKGTAPSGNPFSKALDTSGSSNPFTKAFNSGGSENPFSKALGT